LVWPSVGIVLVASGDEQNVWIICRCTIWRDPAEATAFSLRLDGRSAGPLANRDRSDG
jgi:hypothetical protein